MSLQFEIAFIVAAYLIGSIPVGYILVLNLTGKNITMFGSGNIGSTNVKRVAGWKISLITQLLDMSKGLAPVALYLYLVYNPNMTYYENILSNLSIYFIALASIIGHDFSLFLKFRGGKGVNTTLGASVLLAPIPVFVSVGIYFIVKWLFKYVSLGSLTLSISLVIIQFILRGTNITFYYLLVCMALIIVLHYKNIMRLLHHQELPPQHLS